MKPLVPCYTMINMRPILILFFLFTFMWTCQLVDGDTVENCSPPADSTDLNPNGSSELSKLMRDMLEHALVARKLALEEKKNGNYPPAFDRIHTATPTDNRTKNENFDSFADIYLNAVKTYAATDNAALMVNYNNMVNACLGCHATHCQGPIPKIKKLLL